jgi:hypothetical protein
MSKPKGQTYSGKTLLGDMTVTAGNDDGRRYVSVRIAASPCDAELYFAGEIAKQLGAMLVAAAESTEPYNERS